jgi:hypothetical protein
MPVILGGNTGIYLASLTPPAPPLLLDTYPNAAVAYSLRKLRTAYTGYAIRVRRSSDNAEQDFGFSGNDLDTTSMLDFVGYNMWTYSEDISQAIYGVTGTTKSVDIETAPDGTLTGDKVVENTSFSEHGLNRTSGTIVNATSYTTSAYFKQGERTKIRIFSNISGANQQCDLDLTNGTVSNSTFANTPTVTSEANGWYRFSVTITSATTSATNGMTFRMFNASNATTYTGDGTSGIYVWGYQLSQTSTVKTYQKTVATAGGAGFVTTWYDQSTNANNSTQATAANQAQVVLNSNLILDVDTSKITTTWTTDRYTLTSGINTNTKYLSISMFRRGATASDRLIHLGNSSSLAPTPLLWNGSLASNSVRSYMPTSFDYDNISTQGRCIITSLKDGSNLKVAYRNGVQLPNTATEAPTSQTLDVFGQSSTTYTSGQYQEYIYWDSEQSANRIGIETDINTYWNAY